jgi:hypothetical protein
MHAIGEIRRMSERGEEMERKGKCGKGEKLKQKLRKG